MRALKFVTIAMGVMILAGTGVLVAVIVHRVVTPASVGEPVASAGALALALDEPPGTRIAGITAVGDRLAMQLQGGGGDRVVLIDPHSGVVAGRIALAR